MDVQTFVTPGLGDNSFLVGSGDEAVLVDPQRDAWRFVAEAERRGWRIRHVLETHVHNDYVSGALEARAATGAEIVVAAGSGPSSFDHRPIEPGDEVRIGDLRLVARAAPGHTFQHIAWEAWAGSGSGSAAAGAADALPPRRPCSAAASRPSGGTMAWSPAVGRSSSRTWRGASRTCRRTRSNG